MMLLLLLEREGPVRIRARRPGCGGVLVVFSNALVICLSGGVVYEITTLSPLATTIFRNANVLIESCWQWACTMYYGLRATSASYSVNFLNLIPIVTFAIAIILRLEQLALVNWPEEMKVVGAFMCVGRTMMGSLLKGRLLHLWPTHLLRYSHAQQCAPAPSSHHQQAAGMVAGTFFLCGRCLSYALWFIIKARVAKVFPSRCWATMLTCLIGSVQSIMVGIILRPSLCDVFCLHKSNSNGCDLYYGLESCIQQVYAMPVQPLVHEVDNI